MTIENLVESKENIPSLEERLHTWQKLIKELHYKEVDALECCIGSFGDLDKMKSNLETQTDQLKLYSELFASLISRLEIPIKAYKEKIDEIEFTSFRQEMIGFREEAHLEAIKKAKDRAESYLTQFKSLQGINKQDFMIQAKSFITPFLFQPPYMDFGSKERRDIFYKAFEGWDPMSYVMIFCKELNELFKNV